MKVFIFLFCYVSLNVYSSDSLNSKLVCKGVRCSKEPIKMDVSNIQKLQFSDLKDRTCLLDLETYESYKVIKINQTTEDLVMIKELKNESIERIDVNYKSEKLNKKLRLFPCEQLNSKYYENQDVIKTCLENVKRNDDSKVCYNWREKYKKRQ